MKTPGSMHTLHRRAFLKAGAGSILTLAVVERAGFALPLRADGASARQTLQWNKNWLWRASQAAELVQASCDEGEFAPVTLPHTTVFVPWHGTDQQSFQFVSTYRKHFTVPRQLRGHRVFLDFAGAMTASTVWLNGRRLCEYAGGFTPFSFELTNGLQWQGENVVAVQVDSRERKDIPPFGYELDYLTYGGLYRDVFLRAVPTSFIGNVQVRTAEVMTAQPRLAVDVWLQRPATGDPDALREGAGTLRLELLAGDAVVGTISQRIAAEAWRSGKVTVNWTALPPVNRWDLDTPQLYGMRVTLEAWNANTPNDTFLCRFGFREARFTLRGFELNGRIVKLRGLNRHQTFPFAGAAMPERVQRRDAAIVKHELKCNVVRCSHYPQSPYFLNACDELGLLVIDETPGWQHVGEEAIWQERYLDNTRRMIERDWNHPSVVVWSVRINESRDFHDLYVKVNALAHELDATRQTTGVRYFQGSELLEDVFSMNDFTFPLKKPNHPLYLNTEFVGAEFPVRSWDDNARHQEHILRYAEIYNQLQSNAGYAGGLGWCAFDYQTHADFGSGDHICYHGVMDIFRQPKPAAGFFRSQCSPEEEAVLEAGFHFAENDQPGGLEHGVICCNCEQIRCSIKPLTAGGPQDTGWHHVIDLYPDHKTYPHLEHPPFFLTLPEGNDDWGDLQLEGMVQGNVLVMKRLSGRGVDQGFHVAADDSTLIADGCDATRVIFTVTDEYGARRPSSNDPVVLQLTGPGILLGKPALALAGGTAAVWIRTTEMPGTIELTATHPVFGARHVTLQSVPPKATADASADARIGSFATFTLALSAGAPALPAPQR
jgi:beta-galactosidase